MPPGTPKEAVDAIRTAMPKLNNDPAYLDEAQKAIGEAPEYVAHARLNEDVGKALVVSPELKAFFADYNKRLEKR
jgi:tripartite-type tricarboxylate transporter receptor subunit TctC